MKTRKIAINEIRKHFLSGKSLTVLESLDIFNLYSLADVVHKLRREGLPIHTELIIKEHKQYARYYLVEGEKIQSNDTGMFGQFDFGF